MATAVEALQATQQAEAAAAAAIGTSGSGAQIASIAAALVAAKEVSVAAAEAVLAGEFATAAEAGAGQGRGPGDNSGRKKGNYGPPAAAAGTAAADAGTIAAESPNGQKKQRVAAASPEFIARSSRGPGTPASGTAAAEGAVFREEPLVIPDSEDEWEGTGRWMHHYTATTCQYAQTGTVSVLCDVPVDMLSARR